MADWKQLLKDVLLADGVVDESETALIKDALLADGVIDDEEVAFLVELRNAIQAPSPAFEAFFFSALEQNILADGEIDATEAASLRAIIFADGVIDAGEKEFLKSLKAHARSVAPEFDALYSECVG